MNHLDLFSGIGGFHLAGEMVWGNEFNTIAHVEIDSFCQKVLKNHWPNVPIISDIKEYKHNETTIDLLTGGFPCQPFSCAGKQRGKKDDRYLWPEMLRVISEVRPTYIIGENVAGIINMGLDQVLSDLENTGYTCQLFIIPACAKNAPHRRDRVWIVANSKGSKREQPRRTWPRRQGFTNDYSFTPDTEIEGLEGGHGCEKKTITRFRQGCSWREPWLEVATRLCRMDDGLSRQMDRTNRLKALGNAIVPQIVVPIMQAIKAIRINNNGSK